MVLAGSAADKTLFIGLASKSGRMWSSAGSAADALSVGSFGGDLREDERAQGTRHPAERRRHDEGRVGMLGEAGVAGQLRDELTPCCDDEPGHRTEPAADDDPRGRQRVHERADAGGEVVGGDRDGVRTVGAVEGLCASPETAGDGRTAGHPLETVAVEGADAREVVAAATRDGDVTHLRMPETVDETPVDDRTASDPGADGQVDERGETACGTPPPLAERRGVDVRVDRERNPELAEGRKDVDAGPARLGRREDRAEPR